MMEDVKQPAVIVPEGSYMGSNLPVTRADFDALSEQRRMLQEYVHRELRRDVDFGVIPGTPKPSLYKPGAEKLARLFGLAGKFTLTDKVIDSEKNFAMFTYKCEMIHLKSGQSVSECEAICNSQEKKYKDRTVWLNNQKKKEATPIYDILNTLQKMAQKRAFVGAVILAVGGSDFFTQDLDDIDDASTVGAVPEVRTVGSSIPNVTKVSSSPQQHPDGSALYWVQAMTSMEDRQLAKDAGFRWDAQAKMWKKQVTSEEASKLPFETRRLA